MGWIKQIKDTIGSYLLPGLAVNKKKTARPLPSYSQIKEIGIVYNAGDKQQEEEVMQVAKFLREEGKKVLTLGFFDAKQLPHQKKFHISSEYYWKECLTPFNLPNKTKIGRFLDMEFDLLMNLFFEEELPLRAIAAMSNCHFSMAANQPKALHYNNVLIDTGSNTSLFNLGMQMIHHLKVVAKG